MFYGNTLVGKLTRNLPEREIDALTKDIYSVKDRCRKLGKLFGKPNYVINIFDETEFDSVSETFAGGITVYFETETRDDSIAEDIGTLFSKYEVIVTSFTRKLKV